MENNDGFKPFKVTIPETKRYWEDDATGVLIKRGQDVIIQQKHFRSSELKVALLKNNVLMKEGECEFVYKENVLKISPGKDGNKIDILSGPDTEPKAKEPKPEIKKEPENKPVAKGSKNKVEEDKTKWQENQTTQH